MIERTTIERTMTEGTIKRAGRDAKRRSMSRVAALAFVTSTVAAALAFAGVNPAEAASTTTITRTFSAVGGGTFTLPASATGITVTVVGAAGAQSSFSSSTPGGSGGATEVSLPDGFAGQTLSYQVGGVGSGSAPRPDSSAVAGGGGGSAVATASSFIAVAGGGGGAAAVIPGAGGSSGAAGGAGGVSVTPGTVGDGAAGDTAFIGSHAPGGGGASTGGATDPAALYAGNSVYGGHAGVSGPPSVASGVIDLAGGGYSGFLGGGGGSGYSGGAGGTLDISAGLDDDHGAGGGGSGYLADIAGVTAVALPPNAGGGYVAFRYTVPTATAADTSATTAFGAPVSIPLDVANASGISLASTPSHGTAQPDGTDVVYTPAPGFWGTDSFTVVADGPSGASVPATVTVTVEAPAVHVTASLPAAVVGQPYTGSVTAGGGTSPYSYTVIGALPAGLSLDRSTGAITGIPTTGGSRGFQVLVLDSSTPTASATGGPFTVRSYNPTITVPASVAAGGVLTVTGSDVPPGSYSVVMHSDPIVLGSATVGSDGSLSLRATLPATLAPGGHTVQLVSGSTVLASAAVTVTAVAAVVTTSSDPTALAATGSDVGATVGVAVLLLVSGVAVAVVAFRRRRAARP